MNSSDIPTDDDGPDPRLAGRLRSLTLPETPPSLESRVLLRIRRRHTRRVAWASGSVLALAVAVSVWHPWREALAPVVRHAPIDPVPPPEIPSDELAVLFAPPPVDSLAIVGGRNERFVAALNRLEDVK
jgi:hypothetical protein